MRTFLLAWICLTIGTALAAEPGKFTLTVFDIKDVNRGAGLSILLQTPSGKTYLYDTGSGYPARLSSDGWESNTNTGRDVIVPYLEKEKVKSLDAVLISHAHYDHFGGLMWMTDHFPIKKLIDSAFHFKAEADANYTVELNDYEKVRDGFKKREAYQGVHSGEVLDLDPELKIEVIAPPPNFFTDPLSAVRAKNDPPAHYLVNSNSLSIRIQHGDVVFYLPGDIQAEDINYSLLPFVDHKKIKCNILIAPGHGIHCTKEFAQATRPEVSIASVFPRYARGLQSTPMLKAVGAKTYITGLNGNIQVVSDGKKYTVTTERDDPLPPPAAKK